MAYPISVTDKVIIGRLSMFLSLVDIKKRNFQSAIPYFEQQLPLLIAMETDCVGWQNELNPSDLTLFQAANYLYALCGIYALEAQAVLNPGGVVVVPSSGNIVLNTEPQIVELVVGDPSQAQPAGSPTPNAGDTVVTLNYKVFPESENIFYEGGIVKLYPDADFNYIPLYGSVQTTYTFSLPLQQGFPLKFDFWKITGENTGGGGTGTGTGLQAVYVTAIATGNTLTVAELGTFMSAQIRGLSYDKSVITQTGQNLDFTNVGGTIAGETYLIFYYPPLV